MELHADVMQYVVNEIAMRSKSRVIPIPDVPTRDFVAPLVGTSPLASSFVISTVRQKFLANVAFGSDPRADKGMCKGFGAQGSLQNECRTWLCPGGLSCARDAYNSNISSVILDTLYVSRLPNGRVSHASSAFMEREQWRWNFGIYDTF